MNSHGTFQLQIEYCEINMNTLHSYGEGRGEKKRERQREREKTNKKDSVNTDPKLNMNWAQSRKV
jgi:hypothetical protein